MTNATCAVNGVLGRAGKKGQFAACPHSACGGACALPDGERCEHSQPGPYHLGDGKYGCPHCKGELGHMGGLLYECLNDECAEYGAQWFINN